MSIKKDIPDRTKQIYGFWRVGRINVSANTAKAAEVTGSIEVDMHGYKSEKDWSEGAAGILLQIPSDRLTYSDFNEDFSFENVEKVITNSVKEFAGAEIVAPLDLTEAADPA